MVATVLRIRLRILGNVLGSSVLQLIGFVVGAFGALWLIAAAAIGLFFAGGAGVDAARAAVTGGGAVLTLGWVLGPLLAAGVDTTVDPARLAHFPIGTRDIMVALALIGLVGVPGIATTLAGVATLAAWWRWPAALAAAVVFVPVGVLTCVIASRLVAASAAGGGRGRRVGEAVGILLFGALILTGPIVAGVANLIGSNAGPGLAPRLGALVEAVSWTPVGAAWAVPGDLAAGAPLPAAAKALIALATPAVLWLLWRRRVVAASVGVVVRAASGGRGARLGWFGRLPTGALGATWARSLTYWMSDPRYLRQLIIVPLLPILLAFPGDWDFGSPVVLFSSTLVALILGFVPYADVSYDGTAFSGVVASGVRGRADRAGRLLGAGTVALPLLIAVAVVTIGLADRWTLLPAILGATVGVLLVAYGISSVTSALLVVPVPASGDNPFKRVPGTTFATGLAVMGVLFATALLSTPVVVPAVIAATGGDSAVSWIALAVGLGYGAVLTVVGVLVGGRVFDRTAPTLLSRLRALRGV